jgi:hypothetical protein
LANRILIACLLLSVATTVLMMVQGSDAFLFGMVAVALFGILLAALPALLFLFYSWRQPAPDVPRGMRTAIYVSSVVLLLVAAWLGRSGTGEDGAPALLVLAIGVAAVAIVTIVRAVRFMPAPGAGTQLVYGRSSVVGAFLFLLVAVMVPKFACGCGNKNTAYRSMLKSDLRNLVVAQEAFFVDHHRFGAGADLDSVFSPSSHDSITVVALDSSAWRAIGTHLFLVGEECGIWIGVRPPDGMHGATEGEPKCWKAQ